MKQANVIWTQENGEWNYYSKCPECGNKCSIDETNISQCYECGEVFEVFV